MYVAVTAKAWSPIVARCMHGMINCDGDEDLSLCLDPRLATGWTSSDRYCGAAINGKSNQTTNFV